MGATHSSGLFQSICQVSYLSQFIQVRFLAVRFGAAPAKPSRARSEEPAQPPQTSASREFADLVRDRERRRQPGRFDSEQVDQSGDAVVARTLDQEILRGDR